MKESERERERERHRVKERERERERKERLDNRWTRSFRMVINIKHSGFIDIIFIYITIESTSFFLSVYRS